MKTKHFLAILVCLLLVSPEDAAAVGRRGGGGGGGGRPSFGGGGGGRPSFSGGGARPNISAPRPAPRPNISRPAPSRPTSRPNISRPAPRPSGGFNPPSQSSRPTTRPGVPNRPSTRPATGNRPSFANGPGGRPNTSLPNHSTRPGGARPNVRPPNAKLPNGAVQRPRPGNLAGRPGGKLPGATGRPSTRPATRPTPGNVGDFLGLDKPLKPGSIRPGSGELAGSRPARPGTEKRSGRPTTLPGKVTRPGGGELTNRPGNRPGLNPRPTRPGNRPDLGNRWGNNNVINKRPGWANIDNSTNVNLHNRWNTAIGRPGWQSPSTARRSYWNGWGNGVRHGWGNYHRYGGWFNGSWWGGHPHALCGWHYHYWNHNHRWNYWWTVPVWGSMNNWFSWTTPTTSWSEPVYYDYGSGGNVAYQDNSVYIGDTEVATAEEFAQSAMDLATVEPPASEEEAAEVEWMPLGTFTVSTDELDTDPSLTVQLAVNREGVVAGTLYNVETDEATGIQGAVDRETQRVAIRFGESEEVVAETGLYNLTQQEAPVLVHFGADKTENYLLVRLDAPEEEDKPSEDE